MTRRRRTAPGDAAPLTAMERAGREYREWLGLRGFTECTARTKGKYLRQLGAWLEERGIADPREVTLPVLERYQRHLYHHRKADGRPLSLATQYGALSAVRGFFRWLTKSGRLTSNPSSELDLPRTERRLPSAVLTAEEAEAVLAGVFEEGYGGRGTGYGGTGAADGEAGPKNGDSSAMDLTPSPLPLAPYPVPLTPDPLKLRDRAILEVFYATGMRRRELSNLRLYDLDVGRGTVMIRQGKGRKDRMVPLGERAAAWLDAYVREARPGLAAGPDDGTLFLTRRGARFEPDSLSLLVRAYVEKAGLGKTGSCHLFRHTMATLMLEGGADIRFIQQMLGHSNLNTTEIYTRVSLRKLVEIHAATHPGARLARRGNQTGDGSTETGETDQTGDGSLETGESDQSGDGSPAPGKSPSLPSTPDSRLPTPACKDELLSLLAAEAAEEDHSEDD